MPYDEEFDRRISRATERWGTVRKKMFGGTCHLLNGNMLCGVHENTLIVRLGPEAGTSALDEPHTRPMDVTGRPMKGWVTVEPEGFKGDNLDIWLERAHRFVATLPAK